MLVFSTEKFSQKGSYLRVEELVKVLNFFPEKAWFLQNKRTIAQEKNPFLLFLCDILPNCNQIYLIALYMKKKKKK